MLRVNNMAKTAHHKEYGQKEHSMQGHEGVADLRAMPDSEEDDHVLMQHIACGDQRAFQKLLRRHLGRTVRLAAGVLGGRAADAEDVAQEAFIRVWQHAERFETPDEKGARFTTWLYRIVVNLCIDRKRKKSFTGLDDLPDPVDPATSAEQGLMEQEQDQRVRAALDTLPDRQRMAFVLCFYEEHSNKDAADMMGVSVKALESLLVRARRDLRRILQADNLTDTKKEARG